MATFSKLDENNIVIEIIKVDDEHENDGEEYLSELLGGRWIRTSVNNNIRGHYGGIGHRYDEDLDIFVAPESIKTWPSWQLNMTTGSYEAPIPIPSDGIPGSPDYARKVYQWDESIVNWVHIETLPEDVVFDEEDLN